MPPIVRRHRKLKSGEQLISIGFTSGRTVEVITTIMTADLPRTLKWSQPTGVPRLLDLNLEAVESIVVLERKD